MKAIRRCAGYLGGRSIGEFLDLPNIPFSNQLCHVSLVSSNQTPLSTRLSSARLNLYLIGVEVASTLAILNGPRLVPPGTET